MAATTAGITPTARHTARIWESGRSPVPIPHKRSTASRRAKHTSRLDNAAVQHLTVLAAVTVTGRSSLARTRLHAFHAAATAAGDAHTCVWWQQMRSDAIRCKQARSELLTFSGMVKEEPPMLRHNTASSLHFKVNKTSTVTVFASTNMDDTRDGSSRGPTTAHVTRSGCCKLRRFQC